MITFIKIIGINQFIIFKTVLPGSTVLIERWVVPRFTHFQKWVYTMDTVLMKVYLKIKKST